ncbi:MAG: riboflavin biosynthesis protein RibF [Clostridiales bacterium]|nr:riboflavin biosynthesis protein RibF [Clostridiales bacterium]
MNSDLTTVYYLDTLPYLHKGRAVALGFFDGIHMGHKEIIRKTVKTAVLQGLTSTVLTFSNFGKCGNGLIQTVEEKREALSLLGVNELLVLDFNAVKDMPAEWFLDEIINMKLTSCALFAGKDYRFGKDAGGDSKLLKEYAEGHGMDVEIFDDRLYGEEGRRLSSTWLREALAEGDVSLYSELTGGSAFLYSGMVIHGKELGRTLGFPTVNIEVPENKFKVRRGVYVSRVTLGGRKLYGVTNVGRRPTVEDTNGDIVETFIFDFDEIIYGARIKVELLDFIRPERKFASVDELSSQVAEDKETAKTRLAKRGIILGV